MFFPKSAQFSSPRMAVRITDDFGPDTWLTLLAAHAAGRCCFCCACAVGEAGANAGVDFALCNIEGDNSRLLWHPPVPSLLVRAPQGSEGHGLRRLLQQPPALACCPDTRGSRQANMSSRRRSRTRLPVPTMHNWTAKHYVISAIIILLAVGMFAYSWS